MNNRTTLESDADSQIKHVRVRQQEFMMEENRAKMRRIKSENESLEQRIRELKLQALRKEESLEEKIKMIGNSRQRDLAQHQKEKEKLEMKLNELTLKYNRQIKIMNTKLEIQEKSGF